MDIRRRRFVLASLLVAMFLSAMEGTIVATAMPTIIGDLGGFALFAWVFSLFLLAQVASIPIYGRLSDVWGRKRVFSIGILIFLLGSLLCGFSHSMTMLIISRAVQGMGAGAVQPVASTIVGDIYPLRERARVQGYISSVWALASIVGPTLGGFIVQTIGWPWIFWINVPIGFVTWLGIYMFHREEITHKKHAIDYIGSLTLVIGTAALILGLVQGGVVWAWTSWQSIVAFVVFILFTALFIARQKVAPEPILPLYLLTERNVALANGIALIIGGITYGISSFTPTFAQGVLGTSAVVAGLTIASLSVGWPIAASLSGKLILSRGYRFSFMLGLIVTFGATVLYPFLLTPNSSPWWLALGTALFGFGLGLSSTTSLLLVQTAVPYEQRGVSTGVNMFARTLGSSLWVAVLGSVMDSVIANHIRMKDGLGVHHPVTLDVTNVLLDPSARVKLGSSQLHFLTHALAAGIDQAFWFVCATALIGVVLTVFVSSKIPHQA